MTDTKSNPEKDLENEKAKSNSHFHFKSMRKYFGAIEQFIKSVEPYHLVVPSSADEIVKRNALLALNSTIYNVKRVRNLLLTLPPRTNSVMRALPGAIKSRLTEEANFPKSPHNTRSKRKANSSMTKSAIGSKKEANLSVSDKSIVIRKPIANILRFRGRKKVSITTNPPEIIDISGDDLEATEAAATLLQLRSSPGIDLITLDNKKSDNLDKNPLVVQANESTGCGPSHGKGGIVIETVRPVQYKNTPSSITQWMRTTQVYECKNTPESSGERLKITQSINLVKPSQLIAKPTTQSIQLTKQPQLIDPVSEASTSQVLKPPESELKDIVEPKPAAAKSYKVSKSKFMEVVEKTFPKERFTPSISWTEFLALPNPTVKIKNVLYSVRELDLEVLTLEPTLKIN